MRIEATTEEFLEKVMGELAGVLGGEDMDSYEEDFVEYDLRNRKQKLNMVKDFFAGTDEDGYGHDMETIKSIEADWAYDWEELLMQSSKQQLLDMASKMGAAVNKNSTKGILAQTVMDAADKDSGRLLRILSCDDRNMLEDLVYCVEDMEAGWDYEDFPYTMEQVLRLVDFGFIDVGFLKGYDEESLQLMPVEELSEFFG